MNVCEVNKRKVQQFFGEVLSDGRLELVDELVARDFIGVIGCIPLVITGPEGVRQFVSDRRRACPGLYLKIEDQIAEDDRVVTRWRAFAAAAEVPPAEPGLGYAGITIIRLLAGKQVDAHTHCARISSEPAVGGGAAARLGSPA